MRSDEDLFDDGALGLRRKSDIQVTDTADLSRCEV